MSDKALTSVELQLLLLKGENRLLHLANQFAEDIMNLVERDFDPIINKMAKFAGLPSKLSSICYACSKELGA